METGSKWRQAHLEVLAGSDDQPVDVPGIWGAPLPIHRDTLERGKYGTLKHTAATFTVTNRNPQQGN